MKKKQKVLSKNDYMETIDETISKMFSRWGKKGGEKTKLKGKKHYESIGKKGALKRWGVKTK